MAKQLKDILKGVKASKVVPGSTGSDPGVDYAPKAPNEQEFVKKHATEKHADRVGNGDDVYQATNIKHVLTSPKEDKHGHKKPNDKAVYESKEETKCNMTAEGTACPVHEMADCSKQKPLREVAKNPYAIGMAAAMKQTGDKPPLKKSTITKAHDIAKSVAKEEVEQVYEAYTLKLKKTTHPKNVTDDEDVPVKATEKHYDIHRGDKKVGEVVHHHNEYGGHFYDGHIGGKKIPYDRHNGPGNSAKAFIDGVAKTKWHAKNVVKESLAVPLLGGNDDDESAEMAKTQLRALANKALHLAMQLTDDQVVEPWVQSKIAVAKDYVTAVHDYMLYGEKKEKEEQTAPYDGSVDMSGAPRDTLPNFSADVNTGRVV